MAFRPWVGEHGNSQVDSLIGGSGMDWFFATMADKISNQTNGEVVTSI